ncbi:Arc family DNA-binding protein [Arvimicrobium flavum]|uniref:Arc family DNA-binding protein n=1 Tax=Arvimicrobium flavum TaxID=3393320 RepID=UPI00237B879E|nr:Arc family DNA-binding protein [Mesorhizobium shangrilense]
MAKKQLAKDQDKFIVRLPDGMRERIKSKADRAGVSMNEAIVWALERAFPAPVTIEEKLGELVDLVSALKGDDSYHMVDRLVDEIHKTLESVANYRVKAQPNFRNMVADRYERWNEEEAERARYLQEYPFADAIRPQEPSDPFATKRK